MDSKKSASSCERLEDSAYHIYGEEEENVYETIKERKQPLPETYDEVFQSKPPCKEFQPQQLCDTKCVDRLSPTHGEFKGSKCKYQIKKLYSIIPIWVKIGIPIIVICIIAGYNSVLVTELNLFTKLNESTTNNTSSTLTLCTTTTPKSYSPTFSKATTTVQEEVTTSKPTWNYTNKYWYVKSDIQNAYYCDTWQLISTVKFQPLDLKGGTCYSVKDCLKFIDLYKLNSNEKANYTFYIDQFGNIYEGRDWYCPYVSGELWVALLTNSFNIYKVKTEIQFRHFYEMVSYRRAFEYFNEDVEEEIVNKCSLASYTSNYCIYD